MRKYCLNSHSLHTIEYDFINYMIKIHEYTD